MSLYSILHALPAVRNSSCKIQTCTHTHTHTHKDKTQHAGEKSFSLVIGKIQTRKRLRMKLFIQTKHNMQYSRVIPLHQATKQYLNNK